MFQKNQKVQFLHLEAGWLQVYWPEKNRGHPTGNT